MVLYSDLGSLHVEIAYGEVPRTLLHSCKALNRIEMRGSQPGLAE